MEYVILTNEEEEIKEGIALIDALCSKINSSSFGVERKLELHLEQIESKLDILDEKLNEYVVLDDEIEVKDVMMKSIQLSVSLMQSLLK